MDAPLLIASTTLTAVVVLIPARYLALVFLSPPPIITRTSEKTYRSRASPRDPLPLPSLADGGSVGLSVVIPAYNETGRLPSMLEVTLAHLNSPAIKSFRNDDTSALALKLASHYPQSELRVVAFGKNLGKGGAVRHGMLHSRGHRLLMVDADDASRFEDLEHLWMSLDKLAPKNEPAVAVGSRTHLVKTEAVVKRSFLRNILMYRLHTIPRIVGVGDIQDTQCRFKLFTRRAAQMIFPAQYLSTWIFDVEPLLLVKQLSIPVVEVPVEWREVAGSKLNIAKDSLQMLRGLLVLRGIS